MIQGIYDEHFPDVVVKEGHMLLTDRTTDVIKEILDITKAKKVFEIGFNAGHSSFGFMSLDEELHYHSIDIGKHGYTRDCAKKIESIFGDRFKFGVKDSNDVRPDSLVDYDMVYIDGDHKFSSFRKDFQNCVDADIEYILIDDITLFGVIRRFVKTVDNSDKHPYSVVKYFDFDNDTLVRNPQAEDVWKTTQAVLLKRDRKET